MNKCKQKDQDYIYERLLFLFFKGDNFSLLRQTVGEQISISTKQIAFFHRPRLPAYYLKSKSAQKIEVTYINIINIDI